MREAFLSIVRDPFPDLLAWVLGKEPAQLGAVPVLQGALEDQRRSALRVEAGEAIFLKERCERGRNMDYHIPNYNRPPTSVRAPGLAFSRST